MITLKVEEELSKLLAGLKGFSQKELETIAIKTINDAAFDARYAIKKEMFKVFDRPNRYTINTLQVIPMKRIGSFATVEYDVLGKGSDPNKYLKPQVYGGPREQKRSEKKLFAMIANGQKLFLTPGPSARLDAYGNMAPSKYTEVLSYFQALGGFAYNENNRTAASTKRKRLANKFLKVLPGDPKTAHLSPGIYERTTKGFLKIFNITSKQPTYSPIFDFYGVGLTHAAAKFQENFIRQVDKIVAYWTSRAGL